MVIHEEQDEISRGTADLITHAPSINRFLKNRKSTPNMTAAHDRNCKAEVSRIDDNNLKEVESAKQFVCS